MVDVVTEADGFQDNRKIKVGFFDADDDGVVDNPELFDIFVEPTVSESTKFVFFEKYISYDNIERYRPYAASNFVVAENETDINLNTTTYTDEQLFYFYDSAEDVIKKYSSETNTLSTTTDYIARRLRYNFSNLSVALGGQTGIDIGPLGSDKSQILRDFSEDDELHFFGDRCEEGGNDHSLA